MEIKDFDKSQCIKLGTHNAGFNTQEILWKPNNEHEFFIETVNHIGNTVATVNIRKLPANWAYEWALGSLNSHEIDNAMRYFTREDAIL